MSRPETSVDDRITALTAARTAARRAAFELARSAGAEIVARPTYPGSETTIRDIEPLAGMQASREIELGARHAAREYIRESREAGHSWRQVGEALGLIPDSDANAIGATVAEAAYTYAAGNPATATALRYGRSFAWTCRACDHTISDRGLCNGPADDEHGHTDNCPRFSATIAASDAEWEAGQ